MSLRDIVFESVMIYNYTGIYVFYIKNKRRKIMKKTSIILALSMSVCLLAACGSIENSSETTSSEASSTESSSSKSSSGESSSGESSSGESTSSKSSQSSAESTRTDTLYAVFHGNNVKKYPIEYTGEKKTAEELADELTELTGLDFTITASETNDGLIVDWSADSSLFTGPEGEQKEEFFFFDYDSSCCFMMDTLCTTLTENLDAENIYYTMNGGQELVLQQMSPSMTIPSDTPYMGSDFYYAHDDVKGDDEESSYENTQVHTQADYQGYWKYPYGTVLEIRDDTWFLYEEDGVTVSSSGPVEYDEEAAYLMNADGSSGGGKVYFDENNNLVDSGHILTHIS